MKQEPQPGNRDGLAAMAISLLAAALIARAIYQITT